MKGKLFSVLFVFSITAFFSCSSDPEGPVTRRFIEEGSYTVKAGETYRARIPVSVSTLAVPLATGERPILGLGRLKGVCYKAVLLKFDFSSIGGLDGKTVERAVLRMPVQTASPDTGFSVCFSMHELISDFSESDTITSVPEYSPEAIPDSMGISERHLGLLSNEFSLDPSYVSEWISAGGERSIAMIMQSQSDSSGLIEMNARERGTDPPAVHVYFADSTDTVFAVVEDYNVIQIQDTSMCYVGGVAQRLIFRFSLDSVSDSAMVHASFLVISIDTEESFGATPADEAVLTRSDAFLYYLYTPYSDDEDSEEILSGTGVDRGMFILSDSTTVRCNLRGFIPDLIEGARDNTGLVLQSDEELLRVQKAEIETGDGEAPYIEVIYSLPARF